MLKIDERGLVFLTQLSYRSKTWVLPNKDLKTNPIIEQIPKLEYLVATKETIQIFPGDMMIFGKDYKMLLIGQVDKKSEQTEEQKIRLHDTEEVNFDMTEI